MIAIAAYFMPLVFVETYVLIAFISHFKTRAPYNYRITDLWAATLGLTPTLMLIAYTLKFIDVHPIMSYWTSDHLIIMSAVLAISQCLGIFIGRLLAGPALKKTRHATATSAIFILAGATCGFTAMFFYVFVIQTVLGRGL